MDVSCCKKTSKAYSKIKECIPERNGWALSAPHIIIASYSPNEVSGSPNKWAQYDLGASVFSLILQAQELGYYARQIGSFHIEKTQELFSIPTLYIPFTLIAMGKLGTDKDYAAADQNYVEKDLTPTGRKEKIFEILP